MRCSIVSRAGQTLASGRFRISQGEDNQLYLDFESDRGRYIEGGLISEDGDLTSASQVLLRQFFEIWGVSEISLKAQAQA
jgi:hypothetical protein